MMKRMGAKKNALERIEIASVCAIINRLLLFLATSSVRQRGSPVRRR